MKNYKILQHIVGKSFQVCEREAESPEQAIAEFRAANSSWAGRYITAEETTIKQKAFMVGDKVQWNNGPLTFQGEVARIDQDGRPLTLKSDGKEFTAHFIVAAGDLELVI